MSKYNSFGGDNKQGMNNNFNPNYQTSNRPNSNFGQRRFQNQYQNQQQNQSGYDKFNRRDMWKQRTLNHTSNQENDPNQAKDHYIKQQLINYIYSTVELFNFKYKLLEYENDLPLLLKTKHFVSGNYSGSNCLLVFIKIKDRYYQYLVDRKTLSYDMNNINLDNIKIYPVNVKLDETIYRGTIFDGIFIQNVRNRTYVITDAYQFRGKDTTHDKIQYKILNIVNYLNSNMDETFTSNNTIKLTVNKLYEFEETEKLIKETIPNTKDIMIKGITFYPEVSGTRLIFMFNNELKLNTVTETEKEKMIERSIPSKGGSIRYVSKSQEPIIATFEMRKTVDPDVYKLFLVEPVVEGNKTIMKSKKMGIAYISTNECSLMCRNMFAKNINGRVLAKCRFIDDKNKWEPIAEDTVMKLPTSIKEVEDKLIVIEDDDD